MSVLTKLFGRKQAALPAAPPSARESGPAEASVGPPVPAAPPTVLPEMASDAAPRPLVVTEETIGLSDEIPKTRLPEHEPVARLDVIAPEQDTELKALQQYRKTPGYRNFMDKAKRPPIAGPRRLNIPEEYGGPPDRRKP